MSLPEYAVEDAATEVEHWPEETNVAFPFKRTALFRLSVADQVADREELAVLNEQLSALDDFRPGEFATASGAGAPRGFTTPILRNGLSQSGFPEIIVGGRRDLLTGFLATYHGRTAPGGISNHISRRPAPKPTNEFSLRASSLGEFAATVDRHAPLVPKRLHYRATANTRWREGPEDFARSLAATGGLSFRYAPGKDTVWLVEFEAADVDARPSGGIPLQRATRGAKRGAPYAPLAEFNTNGPNTYSRRTSGSLSVLFEHKLQPDLTVRGGGEAWSRTQRELRFDTGAHLLDERIFDGVREPQFNGRDQWALGAQFELDGTGRILGADHRWLLGAFASREESDREQRALPTSVRNSLPAAVRFLDPLAPDYSIVAYTPAVYARLLALRTEGSDYAGVHFSERMSLADERVAATFGVRNDWVGSWVNDLRPNASVPRATSAVGHATWHGGVVWHMLPNRLAGFFNHSTAFQPARRVDARTGRIIGNEGTSGFEFGLRYAGREGRFTLTWTAYRLFNENITRTNPLYNDPVLDPERRQAQFVSSGEERFTGTEVGFRHRPGPALTLSGRVAWLQAITTSSPDLPEEVGRQLTRIPELTAAGALNYAFQSKPLKGLSLGASCALVGEHVAIYEDSRREGLDYGSCFVAALSGGYNWAAKKRQHTVSVALRNALGRDLVAAAGRVGGERSLDATWRLRF